MTALPADVVAVDGWEPASFEVRCIRGHRWGSYGVYHAASGAARLRFPNCPITRCEQLWCQQVVYRGPDRPGVVEPQGVDPQPLRPVRTPDSATGASAQEPL